MQKLYCVELPFEGFYEFVTDENQMITLAGTGLEKMTIQEFIDLRGEEFHFVTKDELDKLFEDHERSYITAPKTINKEHYNDMLEVLPPCRWGHYGKYEAFYLSERYTGNIVYWYIKCRNNFFTFLDDASLTTAQLIQKMENVEA